MVEKQKRQVVWTCNEFKLNPNYACDAHTNLLDYVLENKKRIKQYNILWHAIVAGNFFFKRRLFFHEF